MTTVLRMATIDRTAQDGPDAGWPDLSRRLSRLALALAGNRTDAEDLVQQTIANMLARRPELASDHAYARRSLINAWLDRRRSLRRRLSRLAAHARSAPAWHLDADMPEDNERRDHVRLAVASLPARQRAVLVLRLIEGLDDAATANALGCSREAVRASLHLARRNVRSRLGDMS